ncbi:GNAT family N-acetyltransferase [Nocardioides sp.]|uniref:GNAT family N-acetyltransferase n=1 Tax=Nocardioides sp. TaxID=35761 RepID=UPI002722B0F5|nr:GNAT family N-acetyltransferase [Nocardioides sp.]MDO9456666.1 GNAT family N-acetyltransferase [Nocardioides sp.]
MERLRPARGDDVATIAAWHPMEAAGVRAWWADPDVRPWVLEVDGAPVGYGELWLDAAEDEVELARLIVPEPLRGRGHGGRLTVLLTAEAATTGLATTMLRTTEDNAVAIGCYAARGFVRLPPEEEAVWNEGQRRAWVWMVLHPLR